MSDHNDEIFEIVDYTVVTDWEKFVHELENALRQKKYKKRRPRPENVRFYQGDSLSIISLACNNAKMAVV